MKKIISLALMLCLLLSLCTVSAFADDVPLPIASVTPINQEGMTYAYRFVEATPDNTQQLEAYGTWRTDFVLTLTGLANGQATFNANDSTKDGHLWGAYGGLSMEVPFEDVTVYEGVPFEIMGYAFEEFGSLLQGQFPLGYVSYDLIGYIGTFDCGVYFTDEFLAANPDLKITLSLAMFDNNGKMYPIGSAIELLNPVAPPFDLQTEVDNSSASVAIKLPENIEISEPVEVTKDVVIELKDNTFDNDLYPASGFTGSIFNLAKGTSVTIKNVEGNAAELNLMRQLVSKDYCVSQGSIIVRDSHSLVNGVCEFCDEKLAEASVPATADNSNMPLWTVLFVGFAAVAVLTLGKKRRS